MNSIASFRLCTLSDEDLLNEVDRQTDQIFKLQLVPTRHIPARPNKDFDLLVGELILRFKVKVIDKICQHLFITKCVNNGIQHNHHDTTQSAICSKCGYEP